MSLLYRPGHPAPPRPCAVALGLAASAGFGLLAFAVLGAGTATVWEEDWLRRLHDQRGAALTAWMLRVEALHDPLVAVLLALFATALLFQRRWRQLPLLLAITLGGGMANNFAKDWFQRERPQLDALVEVRGFGFPSGHTVAATLLAAWLLYMLRRGGAHAGWQWAGTLGACALVAVVGFSRIYIGAHYPSDVAAAVLAATAWACACVAAFGTGAAVKAPTERRQKASPAEGKSPA